MTEPPKSGDRMAALTPEQRGRMKLLNANVSMMMTQMASAFNKVLEQIAADPDTGPMQVGFTIIAMPMIGLPEIVVADGRMGYASGAALMVGNRNPETDPDNLMELMLSEALDQLKAGKYKAYKPGTAPDDEPPTTVN